MKSVSDFTDLLQFGIKALAEKSDSLGFRIVCDLDEQGVRVFKECFGISCYCGSPQDQKYGLANNLNSGSIASVLLTRHEIIPLAAIGFYLQGHTVIIVRYQDGVEAVFALEEDDVLMQDETGFLCNGYRWPSCYGIPLQIIQQKDNTRTGIARHLLKHS